MKTENISKTQSIVAWILAGLLTALYLFSAANKFLHPEMMSTSPKMVDLVGWIPIIGVGEIISALLFLFPKTNKLGVLLLSSYMGGAIIVHMIMPSSIIMPSVVLILVWVVGFLRNPKLFK